jgi:fructose-1,6-bisphosphatase/inositol monophosphatase family enzyme
MGSPYLPVAIKAVKAAEKVILEHYRTELAVMTKADETPVTIADQQAEEIIRQTILASFPDHTFFGEEGEKVGLKNHKGFT